MLRTLLAQVAGHTQVMSQGSHLTRAMPKLFRYLGQLAIGEALCRSKRSGPGGDTLSKCVLSLAWLVGFYLWVHNFNYEAPNPRKIEWHRTVATAMVVVGVISVVGEYLFCLWQRARRLWDAQRSAT